MTELSVKLTLVAHSRDVKNRVRSTAVKVPLGVISIDYRQFFVTKAQ
jgi:hypothetical protein